jgi:hypothetical protein
MMDRISQGGQNPMTADTLLRYNTLRRPPNLLMLPVTFLGLLVVGAGIFVTVALWPTWSAAPIPHDAPLIPTTVADVLFDVPPAAIRNPVQRHAGPHERIDLAFLWPALTPPPVDSKVPDQPAVELTDDSAAVWDASARLFVTIAALGPVLPPLERLRSIYPRYVEAEATAGPDGLAILPFRNTSPYADEDLVYLAGTPEQFFARCSRPVSGVPGTCIHERLVGAAEITFRFPRAWIGDWRNVAAGFDRLIAQIHPQGN